LQLDARSFQPAAEETSAKHVPSREKIGRRAYEIYLERSDLLGHERDDWLRAEREFQ
jgi:hypothetical protein